MYARNPCREGSCLMDIYRKSVRAIDSFTYSYAGGFHRDPGYVSKIFGNQGAYWLQISSTFCRLPPATLVSAILYRVLGNCSWPLRLRVIGFDPSERFPVPSMPFQSCTLENKIPYRPIQLHTCRHMATTTITTAPGRYTAKYLEQCGFRCSPLVAPARYPSPSPIYHQRD